MKKLILPLAIILALSGCATSSVVKEKLTLPQKIHIYINKKFDIFCDCGKIKKWKSFADWQKEDDPFVFTYQNILH